MAELVGQKGIKEICFARHDFVLDRSRESMDFLLFLCYHELENKGREEHFDVSYRF